MLYVQCGYYFTTVVAKISNVVESFPLKAVTFSWIGLTTLKIAG